MKKRMLLLSMCLMLAVIPGCGKSGKQQEASVKASQSDAKEQKSQDMKGSEAVSYTHLTLPTKLEV